MRVFIVLILNFYLLYATNTDYSNPSVNAIKEAGDDNLYKHPCKITTFKAIVILVLDKKSKTNKEISKYFIRISNTVGNDYLGTKVYYGNANKSFIKIKKIVPCLENYSSQSSYAIVYDKNKCHKLNFNNKNIIDVKKTFDYIFKNINNLSDKNVTQYKCKQTISGYLNGIKVSANFQDFFEGFTRQICKRF